MIGPAIRSGVGFRNCVIFGLDANGLPLATSTTPYEGLRLSGAKVLTITDPEPRRIPYPGDDGIISIDVLPPNEAITGELHTGKMNDTVDAVLSGQKAFQVGSMTLFGEGTDQRGFEPQVGLLAYRQAQDTDPDSLTFGKRGWEIRFMPRAILVSRDVGFSDQPDDHIYTVIPAKVSSHLWGGAFTLATEGMLQAQIVRAASNNKPKLVAWKADGVLLNFLFPTAAQAVNTSTITVTKNGVPVVAGITKATTGITFSVLPLANDVIVALYEVA
jgi:hypothetical protein